MIGTSDSIKNKKFNNKQGTEILEKLLTLTFVHFYFNTNNNVPVPNVVVGSEPVL